MCIRDGCLERSVTASFNSEMASKNDDDNNLLEEDKKEGCILDCTIHYVLNKTYPCELEKDKKRAVRKRAATLVLEDGEVFVQQKNRKVKVIRSREDQLLTVQACHSDPTSGHFGMKKTWRRLTERFYWKGMVADMDDFVSVY